MVSHHGTTFALKELLGARQAEDGQGGPALTAPELHAWRKEAELLAGLRHPHVLAFMGIVVSPPCIVTGEDGWRAMRWEGGLGIARRRGSAVLMGSQPWSTPPRVRWRGGACSLPARHAALQEPPALQGPPMLAPCTPRPRAVHAGLALRPAAGRGRREG